MTRPGPSEPLLAALDERRRRALREILSAKDDLVARFQVDDGEADVFRKIIVDQLNDLARLAGHLITSAQTQAELNQGHLERIVELLEDRPDARLAPDDADAPALRPSVRS